MKSLTDNILINGQEYPYIITRKTIKNIYFRVKKDLKIHVSANHLVSKRYIEKLLKENASTILKMYNEQLKKANQGLIYLGEELTFVPHLGKPYILNNEINGKTEADCQKYIEAIAIEIFKQRLTALRLQFNNLPEFSLKTRKMTSKWGVCNQKSMSITLNTELITKNIHLIDYVIIHELCHFKHMNHSKEYWVYVSQFCPYYKKMRKELKY